VTLLVAALIPDAMILVSDQRLTNARTGTVVDDRANKAIADLRHGLAYAYTGIASVAGKSTDEWIMESLAKGGNPTDSLSCLRDAGTRDLSPLAIAPSIKRLAVVGVGWAVFRGGSWELEPFVTCISNFDGGKRGWLPRPRTSS
jgi:hypothetical protein